MEIAGIDLPFPRFRLATLPTPLERMPRLEEALRRDGAEHVPRLYVKRDDLLSLGMGGNKIRNLEFLIGEALERGATDVVTAGRAQSNHCRLTAAACARAGLRTHVVLSGRDPERRTGNLLLDGLLGAEITFVGSDERDARTAAVARVAHDIESAGRRPYVIPVGGSDARGALGHVVAARELSAQASAQGIKMEHIVLATATGGTQAGMLVGFAEAGLGMSITGFAVAKTANELRADVIAIATEVAGILDTTPPAADRVVVDGSQLGAGYGVPSASGAAAATMLARSEGLLVDPVYTGKGVAGLIALVRAGAFRAEASVVFLHTGGSPALFADLPAMSP
jgi:D-cysteine desulfhydrase/L-cysteate sulfo-lyase